MRVRLVTKSPNRAAAKKTIVGEWLRVGRNASCEIHLPDPRVPLEQGLIVDRDGLVYLEGEAGSQDISRKSVRSVRLKYGEPIELGPYRLALEPAPPGYDACLTLELVRPLEIATDLRARASRLTLGSLGLTKRWAAWAWALMVLALFLAIPAARVLDLPWRVADNAFGVSDKFWNPGPVMLAHQPIGQKCAACHEVAFEHVKDRACLECHVSTGHHVAPGMQPAALFQGSRCATCHRDHKGVKPTHRDDDGMCVACHRDVRAKAKDAKAVNASDFARDHPAFQLSVPTEGGVRRVRQGTAPIVESSNLKFPHKEHLVAGGVKSPGKGKVKLECASCHKPDASGRTFEAISMGKHCQECHLLQFEPAVTARQVPHGKPQDAVTVVEEFYSALALKGTRDSFEKAFGVPGEGLLRRAGAPEDGQRRAALELATRKARHVSEELFEVRVCKACHDVSREEGAWKVAPIRANASWMPHARFDHGSHRQVKCADCHDVATSKRSSDVAMPKIAKCRECHGGSKPVEGKVTSNCLLCHGFHDSRHAWDPAFKAKAARVAVREGDAR